MVASRPAKHSIQTHPEVCRTVPVGSRWIGATLPAGKEYCPGIHDARFCVSSFALERPVKPVRIFLEPRNSSFRAAKIIPSEDVGSATEMPTYVLASVGSDQEVAELKKFVLLASVAALVVVALALPALAQDGFFGDDNSRYEPRQPERFANFLDNYFYGDNGWWEDRDSWDDHDDYNAAAPVVAQEFDGAAQSGAVDQSFDVTGSGDNPNQCVGVQGTANTGNAQNQTSVVQNGSGAGDFGFEDSGASIEVSPSSTTRCDQEVNQAASATYGW